MPFDNKSETQATSWQLCTQTVHSSLLMYVQWFWLIHQSHHCCNISKVKIAILNTDWSLCSTALRVWLFFPASPRICDQTVLPECTFSLRVTISDCTHDTGLMLTDCADICKSHSKLTFTRCNTKVMYTLMHQYFYPCIIPAHPSEGHIGVKPIPAAIKQSWDAFSQSQS